jgi:hypothetical protein
MSDISFDEFVSTAQYNEANDPGAIKYDDITDLESRKILDTIETSADSLDSDVIETIDAYLRVVHKQADPKRPYKFKYFGRTMLVHIYILILIFNFIFANQSQQIGKTERQT